MNGSSAQDATLDLRKLFAPRSAALVGATDNPKAFGCRVFQQMSNFGFKGEIYPVNPRLAHIGNHACYPSLHALPETPDHVGVIVSAERVFDVLDECEALRVPFVTVYTGGFSEMGTDEGRTRQAQLVAFARRTGIRIMGPNCNGVVNFVDGFAMTSTAAIKGRRLPPGNVGIVSHSGGLGQINVMWRAQEMGLGVSYQASCGNEADIDTLDFVRFMLRSDETDIVLLATEGIKDGRKLQAIAREAAERDKPIVALKLGRTAAGVRAAASHTGAVAGDDAICDSVFRQYGITRVYECNELYETAVLLRQRRRPRGRRAAAVSPTGGNIVQVADAAATFGVSWPSYADATQAGLAELLPGYGKVANPTDMTSAATGDQDLYRRALMVIAQDPDVDVIVPVFASVPQADLRRGAEFVRSCDKPAVMLWVGGCTDDVEFTPATLIRQGIPVYRDATPCMRAIRAAYNFGEYTRRLKRGELAAVRPPLADRDTAARVLASCGARITEREAKQVLGAYGFPVTRECLAKNREEAVAHARAIGGPVALKVDSPDIPHKTEVGAIRLRVQGEREVAAAFADVLDAAQLNAPNAELNGALVQEMVQPGLELMLGILHDPTFGPVIAVGLGGVYVEVLRDVAYRAAPVSSAQAREMLSELRGAKLLDGVRGAAPRDIDAVVELIVRLSWFAQDFAGDIAELDVNPLCVFERGAGACVVDALMVRKEQP